MAPLFEYRCEDQEGVAKGCGRLQERLQHSSAPTTHDCPYCGLRGGMQRIISRCGFKLTGQGWTAPDSISIPEVSE